MNPKWDGDGTVHAAMVEGIVIDPATQPFAGSIAWAKGWRFNAVP